MQTQIRHKEWGIYQGMMMGLAFWTELSNIPELGILDFSSEQSAEDFIDFLCIDATQKCKRWELSVESFDEELNNRLRVGDLKEIYKKIYDIALETYQKPFKCEVYPNKDS